MKFKVGDKVRVVGDDEKLWVLAPDLKLVESVDAPTQALRDAYARYKKIVEDDNVNHPSHYNESGIECIEAIRATLGDEFPAYCKGNVMKYLWRYQYKNGIEDLKKAQVYLNWMVEYIEDNEGE